MSDQDGIVACMRLNKKLTARLNWFKDQVSPSMWPDHGLANLQKLARSIRAHGSEHTVDRILDAFVNNELPWIARESEPIERTGSGNCMDFGTPEQLAEMPTPQPVGKIMLAAKDLSPEALDSGATAELCARDLAYERLCHCGTFLPPTRATTLRQAHTDIMNLLANLDVLLEADSDGMSLEDDDRAIVEDIRRRWMDAMKTKEKA